MFHMRMLSIAGIAIFASAVMPGFFLQADDEHLKISEVILDQSFKNSDINELKKVWSPEGGSEFGATVDDGTLLFNVPASTKMEGFKIARSLPVDKLRGAALNISARIRGENISPKPYPYNGAKIMLKVVTESQTNYPQVRPTKEGTFGWMDVNIVVTIPETVKSVQLVLGLEKVSGR